MAIPQRTKPKGIIFSIKTTYFQNLSSSADERTDYGYNLRLITSSLKLMNLRGIKISLIFTYSIINVKKKKKSFPLSLDWNFKRVVAALLEINCFPSVLTDT